MDKIIRMKELVELINFHNYNYYSLDNPTISDAEWDKLYDELQVLEKEIGIVLPDSPSKKVGGQIIKGFVKHIHEVPLFSLDKCNNFESLQEFVTDIKTKLPNAQFFVEYKYDGLTLSLTYENGFLANASTRGNGSVGEDVTEQVKTIRTVPLKINYMGKVVVQGEAIMKLSELKMYNLKNAEPLKNARNAAAGAIRQLDPKITKQRNLDVIFYSVNKIENRTIETQTDMHKFLMENKFNVVKNYKLCKNFDEIKKEIQSIDEQKSHLDFLIDGAVIKLNSVKDRDIFGYTSKFPKWAMAYKFEAQELSTKLLNVVFQVGRTGKITPIGFVEPVLLAGATVRRATLNNMGDINRKKIKLNDYVFIRRSNEVIPEILGVARSTEDSKSIISPTHCPSCNSELKEIGANLFCVNTYNCPEQIKDRITHYASRDAMNLEGLSEKTADVFYEKLNVRTIADLYVLTKEQLLTLEGFKSKKADNLINAIEKSKTVSLSKFIYAIGILNIGKKSARDLSKHFKTFENLKNAKYEELLSIYDFGEVMAQNVVDYFNNPKNILIVEKIFSSGVKLIENEFQSNEKKKLSGLIFVLTGTLPTLTREQATQIIVNNGGEVSSNVSKNTAFVLSGENAGSKLEKAKSLNIKIITEKEFLKMIDWPMVF